MASDEFISVPITTDPDQLADDALDAIVAAIPGFVPSPGNLEVIVVDALAPMAAAGAQQASVATPAIFRQFGTQLVGVAYRDGQPAEGSVTITATDTDG